MPRKTRMYLPGIPVHVVQRGNNRAACFFSDDDYLYYKEVLAEGLRRYSASLHAYCLMTNHVHLLITPAYEDSISRVIQHVGRQYVQFVNKRHNRSGTLWEGRHKGSLIDAEPYLLTCYRYIELNPVAASMVKSPDEYRWSSYHANGHGKPDALLSEHPVYLALSANAKQRRQHYRALFRSRINAGDIRAIRKACYANQVLGDSRFRSEMERLLGRKLGYQKRGRPTRKAD